ncbi:MAG: hypothetical protein QXS81_01105 [Candidatus Micrarchaeaceae archaeon]
MPKQFEKLLKKRGGAVRWRTRKLPNGEYMRIAITRYHGPRGGKTLAERPRLPKKRRIRLYA